MSPFYSTVGKYMDIKKGYFMFTLVKYYFLSFLLWRNIINECPVNNVPDLTSEIFMYFKHEH